MDGHTPRVLLVEDDETIRSALRLALEQEGYAVREEADGVDIARAYEQFQPDLAVLDVRLPVGPDGYAIARRLRFSGDVPMLFLTVANRPEDRLAGFAAGADDYLAKPFLMDEFLARVHALLRRSGRLETDEWRVADLVIDPASQMVSRSGQPVTLSQRQFEVLEVLARHCGQILSKEQLLSLVWGEDIEAVNLVEAQISGLRRRLEAHGPRLIHTVFKRGYVLRP